MGDGNKDDARRAERAYHDGKRQLEQAKAAGVADTTQLEQNLTQLAIRYRRYLR